MNFIVGRANDVKQYLLWLGTIRLATDITGNDKQATTQSHSVYASQQYCPAIRINAFYVRKIVLVTIGKIILSNFYLCPWVIHKCSSTNLSLILFENSRLHQTFGHWYKYSIILKVLFRIPNPIINYTLGSSSIECFCYYDSDTFVILVGTLSPIREWCWSFGYFKVN